MHTHKKSGNLSYTPRTKGIYSKVGVIAWLEFELAYFDVTVK